MSKTAQATRMQTPPAPETLLVDGLEVRVTRKRVKNINLRVKPPHGSVEVSAPLHIPRETVVGFVKAKRAWIDARRMRIESSPRRLADEATPGEQDEWKAIVAACVPALLERWEPAIGVKAGVIAYRNMKSRWGSCQPATGRICINTRLALYPPDCLEYVVVHELCHLLVSGHGPRFWSLMDRFLPTWRTAREKLRA